MVDIEVRLPETGRASNSFSRYKPMAEVTCILEDGRSREIVVPLRVGRLLKSESIGLPLPEDEAFDAIHRLEGQVCFAMMGEMLSRRDHSTGELRSKLHRYGFRDEEIEASIDRAASLRFLDDVRFASYFIEERKRRGWGRIRIERDLRSRGVDLEDLPGYPDEYFSDNEDVDRAFRVIERKPVPSAKAYEKLVRHLMSKGFSYSTAAAAVRRRLELDS